VSSRGKGKAGPVLSGIVRLDQPGNFDDAVLIVGLHDVSYVDRPSRTLAERAYRLSGPYSDIQFSLCLPESLPSAAAYALRAEIRCKDPKQLSRADYVSTIAHPWSPGDTHPALLVRRI